MTLVFFFFLLFRVAPMAYGGFQASGLIGATVAGLHHSHSNARSGLSLQSLSVSVFPERK